MHVNDTLQRGNTLLYNSQLSLAMAHPLITLRPTTAADLDFVLAAEQTDENAQYVRQWSRDRHRQACEQADERHWIVWDEAIQRRVGYVIVLGVQDPDQSVLIKRIVMTQKGQGYGRATLEQVLSKAFLEFAAHRVWLDVMAHNERARHLYRSLGLVEEGLLRDAVKTSEGFASMWLMSMLRSEFMARSASMESVASP